MIFFTIFYDFVIHLDTWIFWLGQARHERNEKLMGMQGQKSQLWVHSGMCGSLMADKAFENMDKDDPLHWYPYPPTPLHTACWG